ncbi:alpha/beta-hydrolase [Aaosphaeria arxii CBS 175.79]|uniref:Alpha/beta-hydrolase n=1 Tax=Aaosphaeria arxii CBS 175.79 TaxID=1450172 RepID=A0A6A5X6W8_9PLEO|nr:alpha/beta-hydrolase [Aaosphaeria arxii CBS 175.79]KAF2008688.1 alpha/beta-hydrolase [Aaosphaeria arxii CBS 175.79]
MSGPGLWSYVRQKLLATSLRWFVYIFRLKKMRRDRDTVRQQGAVVHRTSIPSRQPGRSIAVNIYAPPEHSPDHGAKPVLVNWHGSGFFIPYLDSDAVYCAQVAQKAGIFVIDADYRKGPEHSYPEPLEDVEDVLHWVAEQSQFDKSRVAVSGFSAGGLLALVAASSLRHDLESLGLKIRAVAAVYPVTDVSLPAAQKTVPRPIRPLSPFIMGLINDCWAPEALRKDPRVSPGLADAKLYPDVSIIVTCDGDSFAPEADALARKLEAGGKTVHYKSMERARHGFDKGVKKGARAWDMRDEAYEVIIDGFRRAFDLQGSGAPRT